MLRLLTFCLLSAIASLCFAIAPVSNQTPAPSFLWQPTHGPYGATISHVVAISDKTIITSSTNSNGIFVTNDAGLHWITALPGVEVNCFAADATYSHIYAGTKTGLYVSLNKGLTWNNISAKNLGSTIEILMVDQKNSFVYVGSGNNIWYSQDNGNTWLFTTLPQLFAPYEFLIDYSFNPARVYVYGNQGTTSDLLYLDTNRVWRSTLLSGQWVLWSLNYLHHTEANQGVYYVGLFDGLHVGIPNAQTKTIQWHTLDIGSVATLGSDAANHLYASVLDGWPYTWTIYSCTANCSNKSSWIKATIAPDTTYVTKFKAIGKTMYAATSGGIYTSIDFGKNWSLDPVLQTRGITDITNSNNRIVAASKNGLFATYITPKMWYDITTNMTNVEVTTKPILQNNNLVYLQTTQGLFASLNAGMDWQKLFSLNDTADFSFIADKINIYTELKGKIYFSNDSGKSWQQILFPATQWLSLLATSANQERVFVAGGDIISGTGSVYRSTNYGKNWNLIAGLTPYYVAKLAVDSSNDLENIYVWLQDINAANKPSRGVYFANNGAAWQEIKFNGTTFLDEIDKLIVDPGNHYLYLLAGKKLYFFDGLLEHGLKAIQLPTGQLAQNLFIDSCTGDIYLQPAGNGLFISRDHGITWQEIAAFKNSNITDMIFDTAFGLSMKIIYVATQAQGIFISTDSGLSWQLENNGLTNVNMGFITSNNLGSIYATTLGGGIFKGWWLGIPSSNQKPQKANDFGTTNPK